VRMYSRRTCGLCDEARGRILEARARVPFEFDEVLIDGDDALERAYGLRVPVVVVDGDEAFELHVDSRELISLVRRRD
jgi:glutaredoxin-like protein DUF836